MIRVEAKDPDQAKTYELVLWHALIDEAYRSAAFSLNELVRAPRDTGFYYQCSRAGRTAANYPDFPRQAGEEVTDGSVTWRCQHPDDVSPVVISSVVWTVPSPLVLDSQSLTGHTALVTLSGGVNGIEYEVVATVTPSAGDVRDITVIVPVAEQ